MTVTQNDAFLAIKEAPELVMEIVDNPAGVRTYYPTGTPNTGADQGRTETGTASIFDDGAGAFNGRRAYIHRVIQANFEDNVPSVQDEEIEIEDHLGTGHIYRVSLNNLRGRSTELGIPVDAGFRVRTLNNATTPVDEIKAYVVYSVEGLGGL